MTVAPRPGARATAVITEVNLSPDRRKVLTVPCENASIFEMVSLRLACGRGDHPKLARCAALFAHTRLACSRLFRLRRLRPGRVRHVNAFGFGPNSRCDPDGEMSVTCVGSGRPPASKGWATSRPAARACSVLEMRRPNAKRIGKPRARVRAPPGAGVAFDVAAAWLARRATASEAEVQAFEAWLAESPDHRRAWTKAQALWRLLGEALSAAG